MAVKNKDEFQSKYGAPTSPDAQVLIGMRGGKAVYGSELDAADTSGKGVINNTYSQNQAIMDDMFKGMKQSGGVYNPSPTATAKMDQMYPPTAADSKVTTRADGNQMVGANSPEAANMREKTSANNQFAATVARINARPNLTSVGAAGKPEGEMSPPLDLRRIAEEDRARESSPFTTGPAPLGGGSNIALADGSYLNSLRGEKPSIFNTTDVANMPFGERAVWDKSMPPNIMGVDSNGLLISNEVAYGGRDKAKDNAWIEDFYKKNPPNLKIQ